VAQRTARLAASYMVAGFVHGVLNSDNINVSGESFDYGPWRWAPSFDPHFTAAYFDEAGLYAFSRQPEAIHWDVVQLAIALTSIADQDSLIEAVNGFEPAYRQSLTERMLWRLGVKPQDTDSDRALAHAVEHSLLASGVSIDQFYHDWSGGALRRPTSAYDEDAFVEFRALVGTFETQRDLSHPYWPRPVPCSMLIDEVEGLWKPIAAHDDWSPLEEKISDIRMMGAALHGTFAIPQKAKKGVDR
jgi:serine/tyrosine/threonine adenylyltransferase